MGSHKNNLALLDVNFDGKVPPKKQSVLLTTNVNEGTLSIDGVEVAFSHHDKNIVELARTIKINIPAPCYFAKQKKGCCMACVVEIDGVQKYACGTTPKNGMVITVNRPNLKKLRKERVLKYKANLQSRKPADRSQKE